MLSRIGSKLCLPLIAAAVLCVPRFAVAQVLSVSCSPATGPTAAGVSYSASCTASGGIAPYTWSITGTLPDALSSTPSGDTTALAISDTPTMSGSYNYTVQVTDSTPVIPMTATQNYSGTVAPNITGTSPSSATAGAPGFTLTVNGAGFGSDASVSFNGTNVTTTVISLNQVTAAIPANLIFTPGSAPVTVRSGGETSNSATFTIAPPPAVSSISPTGTAAGGAAFTLTVNGSGFGAGSVVNFKGTAITPSSIISSQVTATIPASLIASGGTAAVTVTAGGVTSNSANFEILSVTSLSPASATAGAAGFTLTVNGGGFVSGAEVQWNGNNLATTFVNQGQLRAPILQNLIASQGSAQITVSSGGLTSNATTFTILPPPSVTSVSPSSTAAGGPTFTLTVIGSEFLGSAVVYWNNSALSTVFVTGNQLTASVPASLIAEVGTASITVKSGGATSNSETVNIVSPFVVDSLRPNRMMAGSAGFTLNVYGTDFSEGTVVRWNNSALPTAFVNSTQLTASVPGSLITGAETAQITVSSGGLTSNAQGFIVAPPPTITSVVPFSVAAAGPAFTLSVVGRDFTRETVAQWNGMPLPTTLRSSTQLAALVPAALIASPAAVTISATSGGTASNTLPMVVAANLALTSISPNAIGAGSPGFTLTVNGTGFFAGTVVQWNASPLSTTFVSSNQLTASVPAGLVASATTASITALGGGFTAGTLNFSIVPGPTLTSVTPSTITAGTGAGLNSAASCPSNVQAIGTLALNGTGFMQGSAVQWNGQPLSTSSVSSSELSACVPANLVQSYGTAQVTVTSAGVTSDAQPVSIGVPAITLTGVASTPFPTQQIPIGIRLASATPTALTGTLALSFSPEDSRLPATYMDPALQFAAGGTTMQFTVPAGSSSVAQLQGGIIQQGTVAGTITVTLTDLTSGGTNVLPVAPETATATIPYLAPVITPGGAKITNVTSSGFDVEVSGYSTTRDMVSGTVTFTPAPGSSFTGPTTFSLPLNLVFYDWFTSQLGEESGGEFLLTVPFTISDVSVLQSVTVTLTNSKGTSAPATANR